MGALKDKLTIGGRYVTVLKGKRVMVEVRNSSAHPVEDNIGPANV
jgi:hypothetical protein